MDLIPDIYSDENSTQYPGNITDSSKQLFDGYSPYLLNSASAVCIIFILFAVPGNLITIIALSRCKKVRNATAVFIINLSIADLLFACFNLPLQASTFWYRQWIHSNLLCRLFPMLRYGLLAVSLFTILAITINRYVMIGHPRMYPRIYRRRYLAFMVASTWLLAFGSLFPTWRGYWGKFGLDVSIGSCSILPDKTGNSPKEFLFVLAFVLPCISIIGAYARIFYIVRKTAMRAQKDNNSKFTNSIKLKQTNINNESNKKNLNNNNNNNNNTNSNNNSNSNGCNLRNEIELTNVLKRNNENLVNEEKQLLNENIEKIDDEEEFEEKINEISKKKMLFANIPNTMEFKYIDTSVESDSPPHLINKYNTSMNSINRTVEFNCDKEKVYGKNTQSDSACEVSTTSSSECNQTKSINYSTAAKSFEPIQLDQPSSSSGIDVPLEDIPSKYQRKYNQTNVSNAEKGMRFKRKTKKSEMLRKLSTAASGASIIYPGRMTTKDRRLLKMISVIFLSFVICYLPITLTKIFKNLRNHPIFNIMGYLLIYLTTCTNPIIYVVMSSEYRQAYRNLLLCKRITNIESGGGGGGAHDGVRYKGSQKIT